MLTTHVPAVVAMNLTQSSPCTAPQVVARAFRPPPPATRPPRAGFSDSADVSVIGGDEYYSPSEAVSAAGWVGTLRAYAVEVAALFEPNGAAASTQVSSVATEARLCELFPPDRSAEGRAVAAGLGALYTVLRAQAARLPTVRTPPSKIAPNPALFSASSAFAASAAAAAQSLTEPPLGAGGATAGVTTADDARPSSVCGRSYASTRSPSPPLVRRAAPIVPTAAHTPLPLSRLNISSATSFGSPPVDSIDAPSPPPVAPLEGPQPSTRHLVRWGASCHGSVDTAALATPGGTARGGALSGYVGREDRAGGATASLPPPRSRAPSLPAEAQALPAQELRAASREPREHFLRGVKPLETWMLSLKRVPSPPQNASHGVSATQSMPRRSAPSVSGATAAQIDGGRTVAATSSTGSGVCCFGDGGIPSRSSVEREQRRQCYRSASCQSAVAPRQSQQQPHHQQAKHTQHSQHSQYTQMQYSHHRSGLPTGASAAAAAVAAAAGPPAGFASLDSMSLLRAVQPHRRSTSPPGGARPTRHSHRTAGSEAAHHSEASGADYVGVGSGMVGALGIAGRVDRAAAVRSGSITTRTRPSSPCPLYGPLSQDKWSRQVAQLRQDHQAARTRTDYL